VIWAIRTHRTVETYARFCRIRTVTSQITKRAKTARVIAYKRRSGRLLFWNSGGAISRIEKVSFEWADAIYLQNGFAVHPGEMMNPGRNDDEVVGPQCLSRWRTLIERVSDCHMEWAPGYYGGVFVNGMSMRANPILRLVFETHGELSWSSNVSIKFEHLAARWHTWTIYPFTRIVSEYHQRGMVDSECHHNDEEQYSPQ